MRQCNGQSCNEAWDCDSCTYTGDCEKTVVCDKCGAELYDSYYETDDCDLCEECIKEIYERTI